MNDPVASGLSDEINRHGTQATGHTCTSALGVQEILRAMRVPVSLVIQRPRLAAAITGGVSLAVWLGGSPAGINLLLQGSGLWILGGGETGLSRLARCRSAIPHRPNVVGRKVLRQARQQRRASREELKSDEERRWDRVDRRGK
jgi:hypothetical protein